MKKFTKRDPELGKRLEYLRKDVLGISGIPELLRYIKDELSVELKESTYRSFESDGCWPPKPVLEFWHKKRGVSLNWLLYGEGAIYSKMKDATLEDLTAIIRTLQPEQAQALLAMLLANRPL